MKDSYKRNWSLTIWQNAKCYNNIEEITQKLKNCEYYYIKHKKEDNEESEHYHLQLCYKSAKSFTSIQKKFNGAHIEETINLSKSIQYLIHKNDKDKIQYNENEIITSNEELKKYYLENNKEYELLTQDKVFEEIESRNLKNIIDFYRKYGKEQVYNYRIMIMDILKTINLSTYIYDLEITNNRQNEEINKLMDIITDKL